MKCTCGFERDRNTVLCRMVLLAPGIYRVEILGPDNRVMADSVRGLSMRNALAYVEREVGGYHTHFHWEDTLNAEHGTRKTERRMRHV